MIRVSGVPSSEVWLEWGALEPLLKKAAILSQSAIPLDEALAECTVGRAQLWGAWDGEAIGACLTQLKERKGRRHLWCHLIGGSRVREWAAPMVAIMEAWAGAEGCTAMIGSGRLGWRVLGRYGFQQRPSDDGAFCFKRLPWVADKAAAVRL